MKICCKNYRYQFSQFKVVYEYTKAGRSLSGTEGAERAANSDPVDHRSMDAYSRAFSERVARARGEVTA